jgi:hypothetical protein
MKKEREPPFPSMNLPIKSVIPWPWAIEAVVPTLKFAKRLTMRKRLMQRFI